MRQEDYWYVTEWQIALYLEWDWYDWTVGLCYNPESRLLRIGFGPLSLACIRGVKPEAEEDLDHETDSIRF